MTIEKRLAREASKIRPMAKVHFERMGQILTMFWDWEYRGLKLHYSRMELLEDYESDPYNHDAGRDIFPLFTHLITQGGEDLTIHSRV